MHSNIITIISTVYTVAIHSMRCLLQEEHGAKNAILIEYIRNFAAGLILQCSIGKQTQPPPSPPYPIQLCAA